MEHKWAAEHLHVIRTLMERSAIYRRALGPISLALGLIGIAASVVGCFFITSEAAFGCYWLAVSLVGISCAYMMARRQALKDAEPFWSSPTRRVTQALLPSLAAGFMLSIGIILDSSAGMVPSRLLPPVWIILYGVSLHAAGFFMPRGIKLLGWVFILMGCTLALAVMTESLHFGLSGGHLIMGIFFGGLHLGYGIYLRFSERRTNES